MQIGKKKRGPIIFGLLLCVATSVRAQQLENLSFNIDSFFRYDTDFPPGNSTGGVICLNPILRYTSQLFEGNFSPFLSLDSDGLPQLAIANLSVLAHPTDSFTIQTGRFPYIRSPSVLLGNSSWFAGSVTPEQIVNGTFPASRSDNLLVCSFSRNIVYVTAAFAPFQPLLSWPDPSSSLFSRRNLKDSFEDIFGNVSTLNSVSWIDSDSSGFFDVNPAVSVEVGIRADRVHIALSGFEGTDRSPAVLYRVIPLTVSDYGKFNVEMKHLTARIYGAGLTAEITGNSFRVWADDTITADKNVALGDPYDEPAEWQISEKTLACACTTGFSLSFFSGFLECGSEWRNTSYIDCSDCVTEPFLNRAIYAYADTQYWQGLLRGEVSLIYSLYDGSFLSSCTVYMKTGLAGSIRLSMILPQGDDTTELGQFGRNHSMLFLAAFSY